MLSGLAHHHLPALQAALPCSREASGAASPAGAALYRLDLWLESVGYTYHQLRVLTDLLTTPL